MRASILSLLLLALPAAAQVKGPTEVSVAVGRLAAVPLTVDGDESDYQILGTEVDAFREYTPDPKQIRLRVIGYTPGTAFVVVASQKGGKLQPLHTVKVTVTGVVPPPPAPPGPTPPPPGPTPPPPDAAPIPVAGLHVLIVFDKNNPTSLTAAQHNAIYGEKVDTYLRAKAKDYRIYDKDVPLANVPKVWKDAMARPRKSLPWIIVSNGTTGEELPLPSGTEELMLLLKRYGGE